MAVYGDEFGADDAGMDQLTVEVDGESYEFDENVDLDGDGVYDTAVVETAQGDIAFVDTDADGVADVAVEVGPDTTGTSDDAWDDGGTMYSNDATDVAVSQTADGTEGYISTGDGTTVLTDGDGVYVSTDGDSWDA
jgi:hypothetical protein